MANKTQGVNDLVKDALAMLSAPYGEDITLQVSRTIRDTPELFQRYEQLVRELSKDPVNNGIGRYTKKLTGMNSMKQVAATDKDIIGSYTKLKH